MEIIMVTVAKWYYHMCMYHVFMYIILCIQLVDVVLNFAFL
jgi:hypothetical protein